MEPAVEPGGALEVSQPDNAIRVVTPKVPEWREKLVRVVATAALAYGAYWIYWRWMYTLNPDPRAVVPSLVLIIAETWAYINMCMFVFITWRLEDRDPGPPLPDVTVDVWITCFDEPLEVVRRTAIGARAIRYPHRTYILDDGKRDEMRVMTEELGIGYIRRVGNANAKAGNLNHALQVTRGEFILQLDADHVPLPAILDRMLGYFRDPKMSLVQSPQDFYNVDSFTHVVNDEGRRLWEENRIFYSLIQPGRDHWNASFFCGSCGIIRRSALESVGGFAVQTVIEDMETTIELHARGWRTAYHNETLAYGLAPASASAYHVQRLRWGQGAMQVLRKLRPLTRRDLTFAQRVNYFAGTVAYFEGWQKAVFYAMPLLFFFTGVLPVSVNEAEFVAKLLVWIVLAVLAFELLARGTGYILLSERYTMVRFFTYMMAVLAVFTTKRLKFNVTPKGRTGVPFRTYAPQLTLLALSIAAPVWATFAYHFGWIDYTSAGWGSLAFWLNGFWAVWNCYFAAYVVHHSLRMRQERQDHRFVEQMPIKVRIETESGLRVFPALTSDLNPSGLRFRSTESVEPGTQVAVQLPLASSRVWTTGEVRYSKQQATRTVIVYTHGVEFGQMPMEVRDAIELHCTQHAMPMWRMRYRQSIDLVTRASEMIRNLRHERRRIVGLPVRVSLSHDIDGTVELPELLILEEISAHGARLVGDAPIAPGTPVTFAVPGSALSGRGTVRHVRALETPMTVMFTIGVELERGPARPSPVPAPRSQL